MNVVFVGREQVAQDTYTFWFEPERPVHYIAGQFTELYLPHDKPDDRGVRRWFTLSSSPTEKLLSITTKLVSDSSTYKQQLATLQPGAPLKLADPMGDFVVPKDSSRPLVFVAAGLGITPVRSIIKWLADNNEQRPVRLVYAVSKPEELAFVPLFTAYNLRFTPIIKRPAAGYAGETGSLTAERLLELVGDTTQVQLYISGPEPLTEALYKGLKKRGMPEERLVTDYFPGYTIF